MAGAAATTDEREFAQDGCFLPFERFGPPARPEA